MLLLFCTAGTSYSAAFSSRAQTTLAQVIKKPPHYLFYCNGRLFRQQQRNNHQNFRTAPLSPLGSVSDPNGDDLDPQPPIDEGKNRIPRTGWTHNQPDPSSNFWEIPGGIKPNGEKRTVTNTTSSKSPSNRPRTGWLHNQQPRKAVDSKTSAASQNQVVASTSNSDSTMTSVARWRLNLAKMQQERNHRILSPPAFHSCGDNGQMVVTEHLISLPLHRNNQNVVSNIRINVFFTIVERVSDDETSRQWWRSLVSLSPSQRAQQYVEHAKMTDASSMILYLQGGPGFGAPTPVSGVGLGKESSWAAQALSMPQLKRVVLMDQRGTGRYATI
jgi:hypothetical protein